MLWALISTKHPGVTVTKEVYRPATNTCHGFSFAVVSELPIKRLTRATQESGRASSPPSKQISPSSSNQKRLCAAEAHIGKGIT